MITHIGNDIAHAIHELSADRLVAIPTETVYGLAGHGLHPAAIEAIYAAKQRPRHNPLILHIGSIAELEVYAQGIPDVAHALAERFWPGPLTLLLPRRANVPDALTAGLPDVAIRIPQHPMTLELLARTGFPVAAPSANPFGYISPTTPQHVMDQLGGKISYILDGGPCTQGIESTIVGFEAGLPVILRHGAIPAEEIRAIAGEVGVRAKATHAPVAPGMLPAHYAPRTPLLLVDDLAVAAQQHTGKVLGILAFLHPLPGLPAAQQVVLSPGGDLREAARNLYAALHRLDALGLGLLLAERLPATGLGAAINDRLGRAAYDTQNKLQNGL
jgi:L-threonylcarbamoyladenylate synthase